MTTARGLHARDSISGYSIIYIQMYTGMLDIVIHKKIEEYMNVYVYDDI